MVTRVLILGSGSLAEDANTFENLTALLHRYDPKTHVIHFLKNIGIGARIGKVAHKNGYQIEEIDSNGFASLASREILQRIDVCWLFQDPRQRDEQNMRVFYRFKKTRPTAIANRYMCGPDIVDNSCK